jgi:murein DD-endopeptidase MepM/ murein hydrolase activator NlpD
MHPPCSHSFRKPDLSPRFLSFVTLLHNAKQAVQNHPKRVTGLVAAWAIVSAGGAFAVASLAPDASDLPVRQVLEAVQPVTVAKDIDAVAAITLYRSDISRSGDTPELMLKRLGLNDAAAAAFLRSDGLTRKHLVGRAGRNVRAEADANNTLLSLTARWAPNEDGTFNRLVIDKSTTSTSGFASRLETAPLVASARLASGTIQTSLFAATDEARLPDAIATQIAEIFSGDIDFHRALRKGDRFSITYEALEGDGEPLRTGRVASAEFVNNGKKFQAMWFAMAVGPNSASAKGGYYTLDGQSLRKSFLASPMEFSRVTSGFKMRLHPILQTWKAHLGVDYAAPTGTAVRTVSDGIVEFAGVQRGFGNVVFVDHGNNKTTVYAHLSRIDVKKGERLNQGQHIGAVGSTGWATGPHLHFEFRINGEHHDPLTVAQQGETIPVTQAAKPEFDRLAGDNRLALAAAASLLKASAQ